MKQIFDRRIAKSRTDAEVARAQIITTLGEIRHRIDPRVVVSEVAEDVIAQLNDLIGDVTNAAKSKPWMLAAGATLVGIAITIGTAKGIGHAVEAEPSEQPNAPQKVKRRNKEI
jgi:hypothetical protein